MKLYDKIINETLDSLNEPYAGKVKKYPYSGNTAWKDVGNSEFIMQSVNRFFASSEKEDPAFHSLMYCKKRSVSSGYAESVIVMYGVFP